MTKSYHKTFERIGEPLVRWMGRIGHRIERWMLGAIFVWFGVMLRFKHFLAHHPSPIPFKRVNTHWSSLGDWWHSTF